MNLRPLVVALPVVIVGILLLLFPASQAHPPTSSHQVTCHVRQAPAPTGDQIQSTNLALLKTDQTQWVVNAGVFKGTTKQHYVFLCVESHPD